MRSYCVFFFFFFFNDTATTEIYTLSLHDALPISNQNQTDARPGGREIPRAGGMNEAQGCDSRCDSGRSEEHTSELQSQSNLVCRLLLEKKKKDIRTYRARSSYHTRAITSEPRRNR